MNDEPHKVGKAILVLEKLRELNEHMPTSTALIFLYVAAKPGIQIKELQGLTGMTQSAVSRHVLVLTKRGDVVRNQPGLDLVEHFPDPFDLRIKRVKLTPNGEQLAAKITKLLEL